MIKDVETDIVEPVQSWLRNEILLVIIVVPLLALTIGRAIFVWLVVLPSSYEAQIAVGANLLAFIVLASSFYMRVLRSRTSRLDLENQLARESPILQNYLKMDIPCKPKLFRVPLVWSDFKTHVFPRKDIQKLRKCVEDNTFTLLLAKSGAGKTTLALHLGYQLLQERSKWRFVIYWNLFNMGLTNLIEQLQRVSQLLQGRAFKDKMVLVIIDDVHLNPSLVTELHSIHSGLFKNGLRLLFLSRCTNIDLQQDLDQWKKQLDFENSPQNKAILALDQQTFTECLDGIIELFSNIHCYVIPEKNTTERMLFTTAMLKATGMSLMLLQFILEAIGPLSGDVAAIEQVNVGDAINNHYSEVITHTVDNVVEQTLNPERSILNHKELVIHALLIIAIFTDLEIAVSDVFVQKAVRCSDGDGFFLRATLSHLLSIGELLGNLDRIILPHLTLANKILTSYTSDLAQLDFGHMRKPSKHIPQSQVEEICIALLNHLDDGHDKLDAISRMVGLVTKDAPMKALAEKLLDDKRTLVKALSMQHWSWWYLDVGQFISTLLIIDTDATVELLADFIIQYTPSRLLLECLSKFPEIESNTQIHSALAQHLQNTSIPWRLVSEINHYRVLAENKIVEAAIAKRVPDIIAGIKGMDTDEVISDIQTSKQLRANKSIQDAVIFWFTNNTHIVTRWYILWRWQELGARQEIRQAVADELKIRSQTTSILVHIREIHSLVTSNEIIDVLLDIIENTSEFWDVLNGLSLTMFNENETISDAIVSRAQDLAIAIKDSSKPCWVVGKLRNIKKLQELVVIQEAIQSRVSDIAYWIRASDKPWNVIRFIGKNQQLQAQTEIQNAILSCIEKIAEEIRHPRIYPDSTLLIRSILYFQVLEENDCIKESISSAIGTQSRPWEILDIINGRPELENSEDIRNAVTDNAEDIIEALLLGQINLSIYDSVMKWNVIRLDPRVENLIKAQGFHYRFYGQSG